MNAKRVASIIRLIPGNEEEYRALHANVWPHVLRVLKDAGVSNYSIFLRDGFLFSYMEYTGSDFDEAMVKMASDEVTQDWWKLTAPCQQPLDSAAAGEWWVDAEEIFHLD
jgi:L-rhamnose mutarotase